MYSLSSGSNPNSSPPFVAKGESDSVVAANATAAAAGVGAEVVVAVVTVADTVARAADWMDG